MGIYYTFPLIVFVHIVNLPTSSWTSNPSLTGGSQVNRHHHQHLLLKNHLSQSFLLFRFWTTTQRAVSWCSPNIHNFPTLHTTWSSSDFLCQIADWYDGQLFNTTMHQLPAHPHLGWGYHIFLPVWFSEQRKPPDSCESLLYVPCSSYMPGLFFLFWSDR